MTSLVLSFAAPAVTALGLWLVGNKRVAGFYVCIAAEGLWIATGVITGLWGYVFWGIIFAAVYARNIERWSDGG